MSNDQKQERIIKHQKISTLVYDQLLEQIKAQKWLEGEKLPSENELRQELGVSRISIREAMQKLTALGIVETRQGEGSFVKKVTSNTYSDLMFPMFMINKNSMQEILEYRLVMEVGATKIAAERITEEELVSLETIVVRMEENSGDIKRFAHDDLLFHMEIAKATKNQMIINVSLYMQNLLSVSMEKIVTVLGMKDGKHYHRLILEAFKKGQKKEVVELMHEHVAKTVDRIGELAEL